MMYLNQIHHCVIMNYFPEDVRKKSEEKSIFAEKSDENNMDLIREARREILDWAKQNIPENGGVKYNVNVDEFKVLTVRRGDIKSIIILNRYHVILYSV